MTATDLTPELFDAGRRAAAAAGVELTWRQADAEHLPFNDHSFDVALSCVGVMFAPFHQHAADELVRVVRPGGRIGLVSWIPSGFIGSMFAVMKPFAPPPPAGAQPPPLWGDPDHVAELLGESVTELRTERRALVVDRFADAEEFLDFFKSSFGPTIAVYARHRDDLASTARLDEALLALATAHFRLERAGHGVGVPARHRRGGRGWRSQEGDPVTHDVRGRLHRLLVTRTFEVRATR